MAKIVKTYQDLEEEHRNSKNLYEQVQGQVKKPELYELVINGWVEGVFSSENTASKYANRNGDVTHQIFPLGTYLATDIK